MTQNELTARERVAKATKEVTDIIAAFDKAQEEGRQYGWYNVLPHVYKLVREYGVDKVFYVGQSYHGLYEDDYCTFTYWNEVTKEYVEDSWTTACACPSFELYEALIHFDDAKSEGMIDIDAFNDYQRAKKKEFIDANSVSTFDYMSLDGKSGLAVKVERGGKWKGTGLLLGYVKKSYRYAPSYGIDGRGVNVTVNAYVLDLASDTIEECNSEYLQFIDREEIVDAYKQWAKNQIDSDKDSSMSSFLAGWKIDDKAKCKEAKESFKKSKMKELTQWVVEKTDKKGEDINVLAEHIFPKRYSWC